jgi:hypothetical protein
LRTTLGRKGHRPVVGNLDGPDRVDVCGALNVVTGQLTTRSVDHGRASETRHPGPSRRRRWQEACARHLREIARAYPAAQWPRVGLVSDNAPWHQGALSTPVLQEWPHLGWSRLPSDSPPLQVLERLWQVWRRRATHHRRFPTLAQRQQAWRHRLCDDHTLKHRVRSLIQASKNQTKLSAA